MGPRQLRSSRNIPRSRGNFRVERAQFVKVMCAVPAVSAHITLTNCARSTRKFPLIVECFARIGAGGDPLCTVGLAVYLTDFQGVKVSYAPNARRLCRISPRDR